MINLTEPIIWACEIWSQGNRDNKASGKIAYTPGNGINIKVLDVSKLRLGNSEFLHGILETGDKFTAIDASVPSATGFQVRNGYTSYPATISAKCVLIGAHIIKSSFIKRAKFTYHGLQEFFFPEFDTRAFPLSQQPLCELDTEYGVLSLRNIASFKSLPDDLSEVIQPVGENNNELFKSELSTLSKKFGEYGFGIRDKLSIVFKLDSNKGIDPENLFNCIDDVGDLIALLFNRPVLTTSVDISLKKRDGRFISCQLLPSYIMNQSTHENALLTTKHHSLPIRNSDINISEVLSNWFQYKDNFKLISSLVRHDIGTASTHQLYSTIMMLAVHFEEISISESIDPRQKYQYPVDNYASKNIHEKITKILKRHSQEELGKTIGHIRDEISHVMRPRQILLAMTSYELIQLSQLFEIVIISWIFQTKLGVNIKACHEYQDILYPDYGDT